MEVRQREVVELQSQVQALSQEGKDAEEVDGRRQLLEKKFQELLEPLQQRRNLLLASREVHQFNRDVEDEIVSPATAAPPPPWGRGRARASVMSLTSPVCCSCGSRREWAWPRPRSTAATCRRCSCSSRRTR